MTERPPPAKTSAETVDDDRCVVPFHGLVPPKIPTKYPVNALAVARRRKVLQVFPVCTMDSYTLGVGTGTRFELRWSHTEGVNPMAQGTGEEPTPLERALLTVEELQSRLDEAGRRERTPVAIVGVGLRLPGGVSDLDDAWRMLSEGGCDLASAVRPMGHRRVL